MDDVWRLKRTAWLMGGFVVLLWLVQLINVLSPLELRGFGLRPRDAFGLTGIVFAPLLHGSWSHLFSNTLPLFILGTAMLFGTPKAARLALPFIWLASGVLVWIFARDAVHVGASGLTYGMLFFVFVIGVLRRDRRSIALALLVFFLYGGMIWGVLPQGPGVSFESHLFGALCGILAAIFLRHHDPLPPRKRYAWEYEEEEDEAFPGEVDTRYQDDGIRDERF
ncbi:membrane associated rhomboid family serine protease [Natronospira proteinivora]|uniref:Membrane associated rhomboid family serine protease n=1 Tax=Natronospira proteinivora TaxID=1807133 RepID=A0ABT1G9P3_9GAMM|nr:rhomboid family intramembrane serine protease [Natronospira proteinivora]MCP1727767.1 membrane associated rhomboid family serine protease [Natronospira proteinivora]